MADQELITKSEFAKRCGVSGAAITKAFKAPPLSQAIAGKYLDANHREARKYLLSKKPNNDKRAKSTHVRGTAARKQKEDKAAADVFVNATESVTERPTDNTDVIHDTGDISQYLSFTLDELISRFGDQMRFIEWLKAVKEIEGIRDKRLRNDEREHKYIPRDVALQVFGQYERCFRLQLADASRSIAAQVRAHIKANKSLEVSTQLVEDLIGAPISDAKKNVETLLRDYVANGG